MLVGYVCTDSVNNVAHFMPLVSFYTPWKYQKTITAKKVSVFGVFLVHIFPHSD